MTRAQASGRALIRRAELRRRVPYSDVHIWRLEKAGEFPARVMVGPRRVAWYEDEINAWCNNRVRGKGHRPPGRPRGSSSKTVQENKRNVKKQPPSTQEIIEELSYLAEIISEGDHDPLTLAAIEAAIERIGGSGGA